MDFTEAMMNTAPGSRSAHSIFRSSQGQEVAIAERERIRDALRYIDPAQRDTWVRMGMALKSELGEDGFDAWDDWSRQADNYDPRAAREVWRSLSADGGVTIGSLFYAARANGRTEGAGSHQTSSSPPEWEVPLDTPTAAKAQALWNAASPVGADHPYLVRKLVAPVVSLREIDAKRAATLLGYAPQSGGAQLSGRLLVVPVQQGDALSTLELIDGDGRKTALAGRGTKVGGYWPTAPLAEDTATVLIGEGVATALTASTASGATAVATLSAGNLLAVAQTIRHRFPTATLVILADLVKATGAPDAHAVTAARTVGGLLAVPVFDGDRAPDWTDFNDLAVQCGLDPVRTALAQARPVPDESVSARALTRWPPPQPLTTCREVEPYPLDALPDLLRAAVEEVAAFVKAPLPLVASSALASLSLAVQAQVDVARADKLNGPSGLFLLIIADSGERKSTCDRFFMAPLREYEARQAELAKPSLKDYKADRDAWECKRAACKERIRQFAKQDKSTERLEAALRELEHQQPEPPRIPRLLYADTTPEALAYGLAKQWPSAGVVSAEAGIVFGSHGMGKDSVMRNLALLNQLWDGSRLNIDRRTTESFVVSGARLTVALQVQEAALREFFARSGALARGTGFLARFLIAWPESTQGHRLYAEPPANWPCLVAFHQRLTAILESPVPLDEEGTLTPLLLPLTPEAKQGWISFHDCLEVSLAAGCELYDVRDVASKSADNAARLAALFQVFAFGPGPVRLDCFKSASRLIAWHLNESRRFFGELALPDELAAAERLDGWLRDYCHRERTSVVGKNHVRRHGPLRDGATLEVALRELEALDRLRLGKAGKRLTLELNPALLKAV